MVNSMFEIQRNEVIWNFGGEGQMNQILFKHDWIVLLFGLLLYVKI